MKVIIKISISLFLVTWFMVVLFARCKKSDDDTIKDVDGNIYTMVTIGTQTWMVENLKTTKYNDGSDIPEVTDDLEWKSTLTPAYCWYDNNINNKETYGALYNWYVGSSGKLCPAGWHVPSYEDWGILETFLGEDSGVGNKLKEEGTVHWPAPNADATNETGFKGLPGGRRNPQANDQFEFLGTSGYFWSTGESAQYASDGLHRALLSTSINLGSGSNLKENGYSVRCLKD